MDGSNRLAAGLFMVVLAVTFRSVLPIAALTAVVVGFGGHHRPGRAVVRVPSR